jgi:hypothetical protein
VADALFSGTLADSVLNHLVHGAAWSQPAGIYVQLHKGAPGGAGTSNPAGNTTRQQAMFGTPSSGGAGSISNTVALTWASVPTSETYTDVSLWDAASGGNFLASGPLSSSVAVTSGATFTIAIGALTLTITRAS